MLPHLAVPLKPRHLFDHLATTLDRYAVVLILCVSVLSSLVVYLPFLLDGRMDLVFRHWDGPNYAYLAKVLYNVPADHPMQFYTKPSYFAAHLPVYPLSIRAFSFLGYFKSMLLTSVLYGSLAAVVFYKLLKETGVVTKPLWSAVISLFIPVRYLLYHSIGATEAPFLFFTLYSLLAYVRGHYLLAFALGGISGITRITGILIGGAYFFDLVSRRQWRYIPLLFLVALPLLLTFTYYHFHYGDFFAYLGTNYSSSNKLIYFTPVKLYQIYAAKGDTHSAEFYLIMYVLYGLGTAMLWKIHRTFFWYCLFAYCFSLFIFHQDVSRYLIPLAPLALVVAYDSVLSRPACKWVFVPAVVLGYIYVWGMMPHNVIDRGAYKTLQRELSSGNDKKLKSTFDKIDIEACRYQACQSSIKVGGKKLRAERGLNLFRYSQAGELVFVTTLDHCTNSRVYNNTSLVHILEQYAQDTQKVILLSEDTVNCKTNRKIQGIEQWSGPYNLKKLAALKFRETYIAIIDINSGDLTEMKSRKSQIYPN